MGLAPQTNRQLIEVVVAFSFIIAITLNAALRYLLVLVYYSIINVCNRPRKKNVQPLRTLKTVWFTFQ
ncbi:unnamed protein product, partial [Nesidiocoris tenuis]